PPRSAARRCWPRGRGGGGGGARAPPPPAPPAPPGGGGGGGGAPAGVWGRDDEARRFLITKEDA
ncbi:hypothetical protein I5F67_32025, partial [Pseudomonas aeruginosa]|nr:hypothetical protein [Pseudomonas aeruginosa]